MPKIIHAVLMTVRAEADPKLVAEFFASTKSLSAVDGVESLVIGPDVQHRPNCPYTHMAVFTFRDQAAAKYFKTAPEHLEHKALYRDRVLADSTSVDIEAP